MAGFNVHTYCLRFLYEVRGSGHRRTDAPSTNHRPDDDDDDDDDVPDSSRSYEGQRTRSRSRSLSPMRSRDPNVY